MSSFSAGEVGQMLKRTLLGAIPSLSPAPSIISQALSGEISEQSQGKILSTLGYANFSFISQRKAKFLLSHILIISLNVIEGKT